MSSQLIATKLFVPAPHGALVVRSRLTERLQRGVASRLTLVSAPAGFGKTTLVASWLGEPSSPDRLVAWVSLDPADDEPAVFWTYVVAALRGAVPGVGSDALELARAALPLEAALPALLNELAAAPGQVWLVLDDYHLVENREIRDDMAFFLEHLPAQLHVVLLTRADPVLPLSRWRVADELVEIRADDLRFTSDEVDAYLRAAVGVGLDEDDVAVLGERTEGWIAALQLAALSLRERPDVSGFIARFSGDDRYVVDYLVDEVLQHQPATIRDFLLESSILDRMTGTLCDAVTGHDGGATMLVTLERANLFTVALDDRREWYRYHHLFRDVLRARLRDERPDRVPLLHQRASHWYETHDRRDDAIDHALAGRDFPQAGRLMELAMPAVRRTRRDATMHGWLRALPDDTVRLSPVLSVFYGNLLMVSGDPAAAELRFGDVERSLRAAVDQVPRWADTEELRTLPATIAVYRAALAHARGDQAGTREHAHHALELAGPRNPLARGGAAGFLGLVAWSEGDVETALGQLTDAVASLAAAGTRVDELTTTVALADLWLVAGRPSRARQAYERALHRAQCWGAAVRPLSSELEAGLAELDLEAGELDAASVRLEAAAAPNRSGTAADGPRRWLVARGLLAQARGEPEEAVDLLQRAGQLPRADFFPDVRPLEAQTARVRIAQGRLAEAARWVRQRGLTPADDVTYLSEFEHLTLVRLLLAQHRASPAGGAADRATRLLGRLHDVARADRRAGSLLEIRMLQALGLDARARRTEAVETLADALASAPEPDAYARLLLNEGSPVRGLLRDLKHAGSDSQHVARLLVLSTADDPGATRAGQPSRAPSDPLSGRELEVLRLLDSALTVPQIARDLFVSSNTVRSHTKHIFTKLDVTTRWAAVDRGRERGLL